MIQFPSNKLVRTESSADLFVCSQTDFKKSSVKHGALWAVVRADKQYQNGMFHASSVCKLHRVKGPLDLDHLLHHLLKHLHEPTINPVLILILLGD